MRGGVVTETWNDGYSWYRKWSDGWVEQGGKANSGETVSVMLHINFRNIYYTVLITHTDAGAEAYTKNITNQTINSFVINSHLTGAEKNKAFWYACGYAAE